MRAPGKPMVSVIMGTRNRRERLRVALGHWQAVRSAVPWELIVVDNGSTDGTPAMVSEFTHAHSGRVSLVVEPRPGVCLALNRGRQAATGELLCFTDDDCYPEPDFIEQMLAAFEDESVAYVAGRVLLFDPLDAPLTIQTREEPLPLPPRTFTDPGFVLGANLAMRAQAFDRLGGFDELLGPGSPMRSGGDYDLVTRATVAGMNGMYDPRPTVYHHHERRTPAQVEQVMKRYEFGRGAYYVKSVLDPARRLHGMKQWYWSVRSSVARALRGDLRGVRARMRELRGAGWYCILLLRRAAQRRKQDVKPNAR